MEGFSPLPDGTVADGFTLNDGAVQCDACQSVIDYQVSRDNPVNGPADAAAMADHLTWCPSRFHIVTITFYADATPDQVADLAMRAAVQIEDPDPEVGVTTSNVDTRAN